MLIIILHIVSKMFFLQGTQFFGGATCFVLLQFGTFIT